MLETSRLTIRPFTLDDATFVLDLLNDPGWIAGIGDRGIRTVEAAAEYLQTRVFASYETHGYGLYRVALRGTDEPVGMAGFVRRPELAGPDLGFAFLGAHTRRGYGFESATALIAWAAEHGLPNLLAITAPENEASVRLLEKLGFRERERVTLSAHGGESRVFER